MIRMFDRQRRLRLLLLMLTIASLTVITIDFRTKGEGPLDRAGRFALTVIGPVQRGLVAVFRPVGNFAAGFTKVPSLRARIGELERENASLRAQLEQTGDIARENESLRREMDLGKRFNFKTLAAQVIGVGPSNFERTIFIARGSDDGVRKDMPVIAGEGLAGRVLSVGKSTAQVVLLIDRSSAVAGRLSSSGETGVLQGNNGGLLDFELFDPAAQVAPGDKVVTSGYDGGLYPPGIPVGTVTDAPHAETSLSRRVKVQPLVDFSALDYVLLVIGREQSR